MLVLSTFAAEGLVCVAFVWIKKVFMSVTHNVCQQDLILLLWLPVNNYLWWYVATVRDVMLKFGIVDFFCCIVATLYPYFELPIGRADISKRYIISGWVFLLLYHFDFVYFRYQWDFGQHPCIRTGCYLHNFISSFALIAGLSLDVIYLAVAVSIAVFQLRWFIWLIPWHVSYVDLFLRMHQVVFQVPLEFLFDFAVHFRSLLTVCLVIVFPNDLTLHIYFFLSLLLWEFFITLEAQFSSHKFSVVSTTLRSPCTLPGISSRVLLFYDHVCLHPPGCGQVGVSIWSFSKLLLVICVFTR